MRLAIIAEIVLTATYVFFPLPLQDGVTIFVPIVLLSVWASLQKKADTLDEQERYGLTKFLNPPIPRHSDKELLMSNIFPPAPAAVCPLNGPDCFWCDRGKQIQDKAGAFLTEIVTTLADEYKFSPDCQYQVLDLLQDSLKDILTS